MSIISISQRSREKMESVLWRIFISMQLASMSGWIRFSRQSRFLLGFPCVADALRFTATFETKIKFEIYGHRPFGARKHVAMAEKTIQNILDAREGDGGEQVNSNESKAIL